MVDRAAVVLLIPAVFTLLLLINFDSTPGPRWSRATPSEGEDPGHQESTHSQHHDEENRPTDSSVDHHLQQQRQLLDAGKAGRRNDDELLTEEEADARLLREMIQNDAIDRDAPLPKEQKMWFMLKRRGWQSEVEIKRALEILRRTDELLTEAQRDYFLMYGSLIGHCRHAGFIPWDDDMDIAAARSTVEWLVTPEGRNASAAHGLEVKRLGSGYLKLWLAGEDIPRAGGTSWGYPFLDVFPYDLNSTTGLLDVQDGDPLPPELYFPVRRVTFHPGCPKGLLIPRQPGIVLDKMFAGWRTLCKMDGYNHRLEDGDDRLKGHCRVLARAIGVKLAPPMRCPSASMVEVDKGDYKLRKRTVKSS